MKASKLLFIIGIFSLTGCAHKSGHKRENFIQERSVVSHPSTMTNTNIEVSRNRRNVEKKDGAEVFSRYNTAVFMVYTSDGYNMYQGSGFFINNSGLAVSNYHVFKNTSIGEEGIKLAGSKEIYKVSEIIKRNEQEDFILFKVNIANTNYIPIAGRKPNVGEKVFAIGSPRGLENTFSSGEISQWRDRNLMQISALIDHGSSGGALINEYGEVVGITSGTFYDGSQANLNYAWSIDVIKPYINMR